MCPTKKLKKNNKKTRWLLNTAVYTSRFWAVPPRSFCIHCCLKLIQSTKPRIRTHCARGTYSTFASAMRIRQPTLALKPRGDVTRNPKHGYQWPQNRTCVCQELKKEKKRTHCATDEGWVVMQCDSRVRVQ